MSRPEKRPNSADYSQTRSLNLGVAMDVGVNAALIYDELVFLADKGSRKDGWVYKEYEDLLERFPFMSKRSLERYIAELADKGYIERRRMIVDGRPLLHVRVKKTLMPVLTDGYRQNGGKGEEPTAKMAVSPSEPTAKMAVTIYTSTNQQLTTQQEPAAKQTMAERKQKLLAAVNRICGREFKVLPERGVKKTLDAFSDEEIERALTSLVADEWHQPRLKELSIDYFTRSTTIDKFAQKALAIAPIRTISNEEIEAMRAEQNAALRARRDKTMALKAAGGVA